MIIFQLKLTRATSYAIGQTIKERPFFATVAYIETELQRRRSSVYYEN